MTRYLALLRLALSTPFLAGGCTHVVTYSVPYYKDGPRQVRQPDGTVSAGSGVWIVGEDDSYFRVWTDGGVDAYVNKSAVRPMLDWLMQKRAEEKAAADAAEQRGSGESSSSAQPLYRPPPAKDDTKPKWRLFGEEPKPKSEAIAPEEESAAE